VRRVPNLHGQSNGEQDARDQQKAGATPPPKPRNIEGTYRIVENRGGVCDRQIFNLGSPYNEISIRQLAETMREIYAEQFGDPATPLPNIVSVPGETFYGKGYDDSNRRIPDIAKARNLLGWEPVWPVRKMLEATMSYYVHEYPRNQASALAD
jgi:nucleoside-diphosphate-sugar epimerase